MDLRDQQQESPEYRLTVTQHFEASQQFDAEAETNLQRLFVK